MANTVIWNHYDYVQQMRAKIKKPTTWTDVLTVKYSDAYVITQGSLTESTVGVVAGTRGTAYTYDDFTIVADTLTISTVKMIPMLIDEADRYQQSYVDQMKLATFQGQMINEKLESLVLIAAASGVNFGATDLANTAEDDSTAITVSSSNIDDLIRAIKRKIYVHHGVDLAVEKGIFIVWRPSDFELLEQFVQANGFTEADLSLKNGIPVQKAFRYMGVDHYLSTQNYATHVFAGIKGCMEIGILRGTYGKAKFIEDPGSVSGLGIVSRVDYGTNIPAYLQEYVIDVNVA